MQLGISLKDFRPCEPQPPSLGLLHTGYSVVVYKAGMHTACGTDICIHFSNKYHGYSLGFTLTLTTDIPYPSPA